MSYDEFVPWDVVSIAKSFDNKVLRAVVNRKTIAGKVNSIGDDNGEKVITVGSDEYYIAKNYAKFATLPESGSTATFYFDYYGKIAAIDFTNATNKYGFLIRTIVDEASDPTCMIRLMSQDGVVSILPCAEKVKIDGTSYTAGGLIDKMTPSPTFVITDRYLSATDKTLKEADNSSFIQPYQMIVYRTNSAGQINYIDTIYKSTTEDNNTLQAINPINNSYYYYNTPVLFVAVHLSDQYVLIRRDYYSRHRHLKI